MFSARTSLLCIVLGLGLATAACGGADAGPGDATEANASASSEDELRSTSVVGTYEVGIGTVTALDYDKLTLKSDHTFTAAKGSKHVSGTWSTAKSGPQLGSPQGAAELVFQAAGDSKATTLFYALSGAFLRLSPTFRGKYSLFIKDGVKFPKVADGEVCSDTLGNIIAECPDNFACEFDGSSSKLQRCWPDR